MLHKQALTISFVILCVKEQMLPVQQEWDTETKKDMETLFLLQLQSFISLGFHLEGESNYFMTSFLEDDELQLNYLKRQCHKDFAVLRQSCT